MKANTAGQNGNAVVHEMHGMSGPPFTNAVDIRATINTLDTPQ